MENKKKKLQLGLENVARDIAHFYEETARDYLYVKEYNGFLYTKGQDRFIVLQIPLDRDGKKELQFVLYWMQIHFMIYTSPIDLINLNSQKKQSNLLIVYQK